MHDVVRFGVFNVAIRLEESDRLLDRLPDTQPHLFKIVFPELLDPLGTVSQMQGRSCHVPLSLSVLYDEFAGFVLCVWCGLPRDAKACGHQEQ